MLVEIRWEKSSGKSGGWSQVPWENGRVGKLTIVTCSHPCSETSVIQFPLIQGFKPTWAFILSWYLTYTCPSNVHVSDFPRNHPLSTLFSMYIGPTFWIFDHILLYSPQSQMKSLLHFSCKRFKFFCRSTQEKIEYWALLSHFFSIGCSLVHFSQPTQRLCHCHI